MSRTVLIAGCGDVGTAAGLLLAADGARVWGLRRNISALPAPIQPVAADLLEPSTLDALPAVSALVYCPAATERSEAAYRRLYVEGLRHALAAAPAGALERVLLVSSTSVYGQDRGQWVDENSACEPRGFSGRVMLEAEATLTVAERRVTPVVLRLSGIYGPGRTWLLRRVLAGEPVQRDPPYWTNRIHRDDAAALIAHLLQLPAPRPVYVGVDERPATLWEVMTWLAARLGAAPPVAGAGGGSNKRLRNAAIKSTGFDCRYPDYRSGYGPLVQSMRAELEPRAPKGPK